MNSVLTCSQAFLQDPELFVQQLSSETQEKQYILDQLVIVDLVAEGLNQKMVIAMML